VRNRFGKVKKKWWARQDLNLGPTDYESAALTAELQARILYNITHRKDLMQLGWTESMDQLGRIDYEDTFFVNCPPGITATDVLLEFFSAAPKIVVLLMALRNRFVAIFGLKMTVRVSQLDASMLQS
jgi:hypothetical protein